MKVKQKSVIIFLVIAMILCIVGVALLSQFRNSSKPNIYEDKGYIFNDVTVNATITKDNVYHVEQDMVVTFGSMSEWGASHGIYVYIPTDVTTSILVDGKQKNRNYQVDVTVLKATSDLATKNLEVITERQNGNLVVQMRHPFLVNDKQVVFHLQYDLSYGDDKIEECDFVYFNVWGTFFDTGVESLRFAVTMPEGYEYQENKTFLYQGAYGETSTSDSSTLSFDEDSRTFRATINNLPYATGITLLTYLENGFFTVKHTSTLWVAGVVLALLVFGLFFSYFASNHGQNLPVVTVELTPPDGMDPLAFSKTLNHKLANDLGYMLIYFANKGYLKIHYHGKNVSDENKQIKSKDIIIEKIKEIDEYVPTYQKTLFDALLGSVAVGESQTLKQLDFKYETYTAINNQVDDKYSASLSNSSITKMGVGVVVMGILACVGLLLVNLMATDSILPPVLPFVLLIQGVIAFACMRKEIIPEGFKVIGVILTIAISVISLFTGNMFMIATVATSFILMIALYLCPLDQNNQKFMHYLVMMTYIAGVMLTCYGGLLDPSVDKFFLTLLIGLVASISTIVLSNVMTYNKDNLDRIGKVLGYRKKLLLVDVKEIEKLVKDNPSYYYDVLPYVYVMGIEDEFSKKFANIKITSPSWYEGDVLLNYWLLRSMMRTSHAHVITHVQPKVTKSGGFGGFGGGGHSGGFGGFSGGGFGGGGGGRC